MTQTPTPRREPHRHRFIVPVMGIGGFAVVADAGLCECGAWRKAPIQLIRDKKEER